MSADTFPDAEGRAVIEAMVGAIETNAERLSEIDGAIGDGDHGINMRKGFRIVREQLSDDIGLSAGLVLVGDTLLTRIGGAMGPLYGSFFLDMGAACEGQDLIDAARFATMLEAGRGAIEDIGGAGVGDKTLLDTLVPASEAYRAAVESGASFSDALAVLAESAERGKDSTRDMVAKIGRASRLGERSRGHLDAGATSCWLLLSAMATSMQELLVEPA